uniref:Uncharacterized protein n=1 Tax=Arundo donax TaxID=35708 RepID=A0A0A9BM14_ARUDO
MTQVFSCNLSKPNFTWQIVEAQSLRWQICNFLSILGVVIPLLSNSGMPILRNSKRP